MQSHAPPGRCRVLLESKMRWIARSCIARNWTLLISSISWSHIANMLFLPMRHKGLDSVVAISSKNPGHFLLIYDSIFETDARAVSTEFRMVIRNPFVSFPRCQGAHRSARSQFVRFLVYCKVDAQGLSSFPAPSFYVRGDVDNASFVCPSAGAYIGRDVVGRFRLS